MNSTFSPTRKRAVVLGGSFAGLVTARVLSEHYKQVIIIEKDPVHHYPESRKGQPQTKHLHGLLPKGLHVLCDYFPGLFEEVIANGGIACDFGASMNWFTHGGFKKRVLLNIDGVSLSRPLLEHLVRERVIALPNVSVLESAAVKSLMPSEDSQGVRGVVIEHRDTATRTTITGDLIVDCTGRGSRTPGWLKELGYDDVPTKEVKIEVTYTTRLYKRDPADPRRNSWMACTPEAPKERRNGAAFAIENNQWIISVGGWHGEKAATDEREFLAFLKTLPNPEIYDIASNCEPLSDIIQYRYPNSVRRNYEKLKRFPVGFLVLGDAALSFNPVYGQGISSACLQAVELDKILKEKVEEKRLAKIFFRRTLKIKDKLWQMSTNEDFRFPETTGSRPFGIKIINGYVSLVHKATIRDEVVCKAFLKVMGLIEPPSVLLSPGIMWRIIKAAAKKAPERNQFIAPAEVRIPSIKSEG